MLKPPTKSEMLESLEASQEMEKIYDKSRENLKAEQPQKPIFAFRGYRHPRYDQAQQNLRLLAHVYFTKGKEAFEAEYDKMFPEQANSQDETPNSAPSTSPTSTNS